MLDWEDLEENSEAPVRCPYCERESREHEVLYASEIDGTWSGALKEAARQLDSELSAALESFFASGASQPAMARLALLELLGRLADYDRTPEWAEYVSTRTYWLELADELLEGTVIRSEPDGGPGQSDTCFHGYFREPARGIEALLASARKDVALLVELAHRTSASAPTKNASAKEAPARNR